MKTIKNSITMLIINGLFYLFITIITGCVFSGQTDLNKTGDYIIVSTDTDVNEPDWIDDNSIVITSIDNGQYHINTVDLVNKTSTPIFTAPAEIVNIYGLNVSATGEYLISHAWMEAGGNKVLVVKL